MSSAAPPAPAPNDSITFLGDTEITYATREDDIPDRSFAKVKLTGSDSIYYVYPEVNECGHSAPEKVQVVTSTEYVPLQFPPKSCKGFSKDGIILFETFNYGGHSQNFVGTGSTEATFPEGSYMGVSSFNVMDGTWQLHGNKGGSIVVKIKDDDGCEHRQTDFGPGTVSDMPKPSDKVASIKRIR